MSSMWSTSVSLNKSRQVYMCRKSCWGPCYGCGPSWCSCTFHLGGANTLSYLHRYSVQHEQTLTSNSKVPYSYLPVRYRYLPFDGNRLRTWSLCDPVLWNRNNFLQFRFRVWKSFGSESRRYLGQFCTKSCLCIVKGSIVSQKVGLSFF